MKLISINQRLIDKYLAVDSQVLTKSHRPTVLVVSLKYNGERRDFAVPFRSNIHPSSPKSEYFALPPRKTTKPKHHHGLHYIKMFPVAKKYYERYRIEGDIASKMYLAIIDKNEKDIVHSCQLYLDRYEHGLRPQYCTDIDKLIEVLESLP